MPSLRQSRSVLRISCLLSSKTLLFVAICFLHSITFCRPCQTCYWRTHTSTAAIVSPPHHDCFPLKFVGTTAFGTHSPATSVAVAVARQQSFAGADVPILLSNDHSSFKERLLRPKSISTTPTKPLPVSIAAAVAVGAVATVQRRRSHEFPFQRSEPAHHDIEGETAKEDKDSITEEPSELSTAMIGAIGIYKNFISPLLPPACRFVPTCSQYGVQAIKEFGPTRGAILTLWRLLRCSPFGGKGYDPPRWPPVKYTYSSY